jgi:DNA polymerase (family 10)
MTKETIAAALSEIGTLLELKGESSFRTNAYHNAARALEQLEGDFAALVRDKKLGTVRGLGSALVEKITTLFQTGELPYLTDLRAEIPAGLLQMLRVPGLGPKKVKVLYDSLSIQDLVALEVACREGSVAKLKGFGVKTQEKILGGLKYLAEVGNRVRFDQAFALGQALYRQLSELPGVIRSALCGSIRRRRETAKDIDILISSDDPKPIMQAFVSLPQVLQITGHGETKSSVVAQLELGTKKLILNADLRVVPDEVFPFALHHFTGSKEHNVRMRSRALDRGLTLSEWGLTHLKTNRPVPCEDEAAIFAALDLAYIPPEMREDTGEIELAEAGSMPRLIEASDLRGVFHNHTTYSDGANSLEEMALATKALGLEYFGVGDHSQSLKVANGLSPEAVRKQHREIDEVNRKLKGVKILKGIECDILEDGSMDYDDEFLTCFDYVVASVHTHFGLDIEAQTDRICKALAHPSVTMLGHATGRLLLKREGYQVDLERVLQTAAKYGKMIEINANPYRLDLDWTHCKRAKALGIPLVINPDAHSTDDLNYIHDGINVARRAWLEAADIFNTLSLEEVEQRLAEMRSGGS